MVKSERIEEIAENIDKLIYDFIPDLEGIKISKETKLKIVEDTLEHIGNNQSKKQKLFISLPQPFLADWVCRHKDEIKKQVYNDQDE
ncbi:MAG: hypothetical protein GPJ54_08145 [Candidatus Heimdallarchaeota archaeon]|nr:hypothetical protein [Candidatus Heimdallarchaeota archaeon]